MEKGTRFVGLDVHKETIAVAVAEMGGEVRSVGTIPNDLEAVRRMVRKLGGPEGLKVCYEAGPCGYVLYWQMAKLGVACAVVAPTLIPEKAGDRVKTDRRDAEKLARLFRAGELTAVWVPDAEHEALRDLVRAREAAKADQRRARQRLLKFLLRRGCVQPAKMRSWTESHRAWVMTLTFPQRALEETLTDYATEVDHQHEKACRQKRDEKTGRVVSWQETGHPKPDGRKKRRLPLHDAIAPRSLRASRVASLLRHSRRERFQKALPALGPVRRTTASVRTSPRVHRLRIDTQRTERDASASRGADRS
jgi:transposase